MSDMRVLGRIRLSRATEESTSVERQREIIERWARDNEHEIVGWAEDQDVSGSVDPFATPALGAWLAEDKAGEWDILVAWKLDRLGRDAIRLNKLFGWAIDHGKTVATCTEGIDLSTPVGRLIANVIAFLAEGELEAIRERNRASARKLRETGRWAGGKPVYGYEAQELPGGGWTLVPDSHSSTVLCGIIDRVLHGESLGSIADGLTQQGVLTPNDYIRYRSGRKPQGHAWTSGNLSRLLRSRSLLGFTTHDGTTVRDAQGLPVQKGPTLVTQETFNKLQSVLEGRAVLSSTRTRKTSPLLGVLLCAVCEGRMYHRHVRQDKYQHRYYICRKGHEVNSVRADDAEGLVEHEFLRRMGDQRLRERVYVPAESHQEELDEALRAVDELTSLVGTATSTSMRSRLLEQLSALDSRLAELEQLPVSEAHWEYSHGTKTYREAWETADTEERRQILLKSGVALRVQQKGKAGLVSDWVEPRDIEELLSS